MDVKERLAQDMARAEERKAQVREDFPWCTSFADMVRDAFGPGVKAVRFVENGKTIGKAPPACNVDAFRYLDMVDSFEHMQRGYKSGSLKPETKKSPRR
jgi:hypothetical protein